jgi:probable phosphoglycerate mutase
MKLLIVRHGDPDYAIDSLTEKGWREAKLLSDRLVKVQPAACYVSPLGRAKDTAKCTLERTHWPATELPWLREFQPRIHRPDVADSLSISWDWLPQDWTAEPRFYDLNRWLEPEVFQNSEVPEQYRWVTEALDQLLLRHGYAREGMFYRAERPSNDTIVFFCHFGVECVLLSRLLNVSPMVLWHGTCAAPSSVTTVVTEERRRGIASWRMSSFGDISHLYAGNEPPAFAARFCECYDNADERRD